MIVLLINGSPKNEGNTFLALTEVTNTLKECGVDSEIFWIGNKPMQGCISCYKCMLLGHCIFRDEITTTLEKKLMSATRLWLALLFTMLALLDHFVHYSTACL